MRKILWVIVVVLAFNATAQAVEGVVAKGTLDNGFSYSLQPSFLKNTENSQEDLLLNLNVQVAAFQESIEQQGYASLIGQFNDDLFTRSYFNSTQYLHIVENLNPQKMQQALQRMKGVATGSRLSQANLSDAFKRSLRQVAIDHSYRNDSLYFQPPVVDADVLKTVRLEALQAFFTRWYQPHYMHLSVVGKFDTEQMQQQIVDIFGDLKSNSLPREPRALYQIPSGIEHVIAHQLRVNQLQVLLPLEPRKNRAKKQLQHNLLVNYINIGLRIEVNPEQNADAEIFYHQNKPYIKITSRYKLPVSDAVKNIIKQLNQVHETGFREFDIGGIKMWLRESGAGPEPLYDTSLREIASNLYRRHLTPDDAEEADDYSLDDADYKVVDRQLKQILSAKISLTTLQPDEISTQEKQKVKKLIDDYNRGK